MKQESQLVTYAAGPVKSMIDYIIVRQEDKAKVNNVKVIPNEECVPMHKLLVMVMRFNTTKRWRKWKYFDVNEHWQQMNNIMMDTAQVTCGLSKGPYMQA